MSHRDEGGICFCRSARGGWSDGGGGKDIVHAARSVAFGVDGDIEEAERLDGRGDLFQHGEREGAGEIFAGDLDAGEVAVVAYADLGEAKDVESGFSLLDL